MINYNRVKRIRAVIYAFLTFLFFLPIILTIIIFFNIMLRLGQVSEAFGRLESAISENYSQNHPGEVLSPNDAEGQSFTPSSSLPSSSQASASQSSSAVSSTLIPSSISVSSSYPDSKEDNNGDDENDKDESEESDVPPLTESQTSSQGVSSWSDDAPSTWNPDSGR